MCDSDDPAVRVAEAIYTHSKAFAMAAERIGVLADEHIEDAFVHEALSEPPAGCVSKRGMRQF